MRRSVTGLVLPSFRKPPVVEVAMSFGFLPIRRIAKAIARYAAQPNPDQVRRCRRMNSIEEHERQRLDGMIAALYRRFSRPRASV